MIGKNKEIEDFISSILIIVKETEEHFYPI